MFAFVFHLRHAIRDSVKSLPTRPGRTIPKTRCQRDRHRTGGILYCHQDKPDTACTNGPDTTLSACLRRRREPQRRRRASPLGPSCPRWSRDSAPSQRCTPFWKSLRIANEAVADGVVVLEGSGDLVRLVARNHLIGSDVARTGRIELVDISRRLTGVGAIIAVIDVI